MAVTRVSTDGLADSAVNSAKIGVDVITDADLANNSVTVNEIADLAVTHSKLHNTMNLSSKTVTLPPLASLSVSDSGAPGLSGNGATTQLQIKSSAAYTGIGIGSGASQSTIGLNSDSGLHFTANAAPANLGGGDKIAYKFSSGTSGGGGPADLITVQTDGKLGIGTTSPGASLHVAKPSTPAVNTNATETVVAFGVDGNEHGHIRAHATTMNSGLRAMLYDTDGGSDAYGYSIHGYHTRFLDVGRADQGNYFDGANGDGRYLGGLSGNPRYNRWWAFSGSILANNTYYPIAYNMNESKFTLEIFCGDASSRDYKKYVGYYTSPAYGVYGLTQVQHMNGGWNSGTPEMRVSSPNGNLSIDLKFQSYYSTSNVASYRCIFRSFV